MFIQIFMFNWYVRDPHVPAVTTALVSIHFTLNPHSVCPVHPLL